MESNSLITITFLEHIFGRKVADFVCCEGTKPGDNYLSKIYNVEASFHKESKGIEKQCIIVKCDPVNQRYKEFLQLVPLFETEYMVYAELLPALNALAEEANAKVNMNSSNDFRFNCPKFYGGNIVGSKILTTFNQEPWINENIIILEDLRKKAPGFQMLRVGELGLQHCLLAINQLANLHALSWVHKKRHNLEFLIDKFSYLEDSLYNPAITEPYWTPIVTESEAHALRVVKEEFGETSDIYQRFKELMSKGLMAMIKMYFRGKNFNEGEVQQLLRVVPDNVSSTSEEPWLVAAHCDLWIYNLMYSFNSDKIDDNPNGVILVDFQMFKEACLTTDLVYFMYTSTSVGLRKESLHLMLETYVERFGAICSVLDIAVPVGFNLENLLGRWHRARLYGLLMIILEKSSRIIEIVKSEYEDEIF